MLEAGGASPLLVCPKRHSSPGWQQGGAQTQGKAAFHLILVSQGQTPLPGV